MARHLGLDFATPRSAIRPWQWLLLAAGMAGLAWAGLAYRQAEETRGLLQARVHSLQQSRAAQAAPARMNAQAAATEAAQGRALNRLELPWDRFLAGLQAARPGNVALLSLDLDGTRGQFDLTAEAADDAAMLRFYEALQADDHLGDVVLTRHGYEEDRAATPLRFTIRARWTAVAGERT